MHAVTLSCNSLSYPPVRQYVWYMKKDDYQGNIEVSYHQNYTVNSDKPGVYYCTAENEIDKRMSDPIEMFLYSECISRPCIILGMKENTV